jgi:hypothetical protein
LCLMLPSLHKFDMPFFIFFALAWIGVPNILVLSSIINRMSLGYSSIWCKDIELDLTQKKKIRWVQKGYSGWLLLACQLFLTPILSD